MNCFFLSFKCKYKKLNQFLPSGWLIGDSKQCTSLKLSSSLRPTINRFTVASLQALTWCFDEKQDYTSSAANTPIKEVLTRTPRKVFRFSLKVTFHLFIYVVACQTQGGNIFTFNCRFEECIKVLLFFFFIFSILLCKNLKLMSREIFIFFFYLFVFKLRVLNYFYIHIWIRK